MITREIVDAHLFVHPDGVERWTITTRNEDGTVWQYLLPSETFENLAAEYGFDENDIDTLLKVAMLQCHIPEPRLPQNHATDVAAKMGHVRNGRPVVLENADSIEQARLAHLARIEDVEQNLVRIVQPKSAGPSMRVMALDINPDQDAEVDPHERLAALKATYKPDQERLKQKRQALQQILGRAD